MLPTPQTLLIGLALELAAGSAGLVSAWWLRRRTMLSARNLQLLVVLVAACTALSFYARWWTLAVALIPVLTYAWAAAAAGHRWRRSDLGAGEELRHHELARRWLWQTPAPAVPGERRWIGPQGEVVRRREWPAEIPYVPMTTEQGPDCARVPLGEGEHAFVVGATKAGKTTSARRIAAARALRDGAAVLLIDQKGDPSDEREMRQLAAAAGKPFVLFDPAEEQTDRWQPLWGTAADVVARAVEPIDTSQEDYYPTMLEEHLTLVVSVLKAAGRWPMSLPLLADAARLERYEDVLALAADLDESHESLRRRATEHTAWVNSADGRRALGGAVRRLTVTMGESWRTVLTPRATRTGETVAVRLVEAINAGAMVMWRTRVDEQPKHAARITVLALADIHAAAAHADNDWLLLLDEFGGVIQIAAQRAVALLQRARSHHGQVVIITQSVADIEALSATPGLLGSLTDNFVAFVIHRQVDPTSRDWLAKMIGTRALWQSTDQTIRHGAGSGNGSRRRVREFRVGSDVFARLRTGQAVIYTVHGGPEPMTADIVRVALPDRPVERIGAVRHPVEVPVTGAVSLFDAPNVDEIDAPESSGRDDDLYM